MRRPAATFIFLTVMLDMLALGMIAPVLPRLIEGFLGGNVSSAAKMLGIFGTTFAGDAVLLLAQSWGRFPTALGDGPLCCFQTSGWRRTIC